MKSFSWLVCFTLVLFACSSESAQEDSAEGAASADEGQMVDVAAEEEALRTADQEALRAFRAGDGEAFDALYADDAVLVNPGEEPLEGRAAIDSLHRGEMAKEGYDVSWGPVRVDVSESGDLGYVYGRWTSSGQGPSGPSDDHGYYINVYRKIDGSWRTVAEVNGTSKSTTPD